MGIAEKIIQEIKSQKHETVEEAIDKTVKSHETKVEDYYFMSFDINNDVEGEDMEVEKVKISYNNELQLMGAIGKQVTARSENDMYVMFLNKKRAVSLLEKIGKWEDI
jgi:Mg2+ and Co2+ transporter CorA